MARRSIRSRPTRSSRTRSSSGAGRRHYCQGLRPLGALGVRVSRPRASVRFRSARRELVHLVAARIQLMRAGASSLAPCRRPQYISSLTWSPTLKACGEAAEHGQRGVPIECSGAQGRPRPACSRADAPCGSRTLGGHSPVLLTRGAERWPLRINDPGIARNLRPSTNADAVPGDRHLGLVRLTSQPGST